MSLLLVLKLGLVPALIGAVTIVGRRWGPSVAGWLSAFPIVSAPILFFITVEQGPVFAAQAAAATLSAVLAILVFALSYAWAATKYQWGMCASAGFVAYFAAVTCLRFWGPSLPVAAAAVVGALIVAPRLFPTLAIDIRGAQARPNDMHWRMIAGAMLVLLVTQFSARLGPQLSGVFAMFPVMGSVLAVFSHRNYGAGFAVNLLRGTVLGYYAFAVFCIALSLTLSSMNIAPAFLASLVCAIAVQCISRVYLHRTSKAVLPPAPPSGPPAALEP